MQNDGVVDFCNKNAAHFRGLCNLPMQNGGEAAAAELERAMGKGLLGCIISDRIGAHALDEPQYEEFWAAAERLGALVFIHPDFADYKPLFPYYMANCVGNPLSTTVAATRLIFSGHFERYPNLQLLLATRAETSPGLSAASSTAGRRGPRRRRTRRIRPGTISRTSISTSSPSTPPLSSGWSRRWVRIASCAARTTPTT